MKRLTSMILAVVMVFALACPAFAAESDTHNLKIVVGTRTERRTDIPETRAVNVPTSYAPSSWYSRSHSWTAKYYTWSSYIFLASVPSAPGESFYCEAQQPFSVEVYYTDGTSDGAIAADYVDGAYTLQLFVDYDYYVKIINDDTTSITSNASYTVG